MKRVLMIDNYDSFTYNLVQYLAELGAEVTVWRNDQFELDDVTELVPELIVISPGPGRPESAGLSMPLIKRFAGEYPILGVCLGHQAIAQVYGGGIVRAERIMHGKTSEIRHDGRGVFRGLSESDDGHALPQPPARARDRSSRNRGVRGDSGGRDHGASGAGEVSRGRSVSSRVDSLARGQGAAQKCARRRGRAALREPARTRYGGPDLRQSHA